MYTELKQKHEWFEEFRTTQRYKDVVKFVEDYSNNYFNTTKNLSVVPNLDNNFFATRKHFSPTPREHNLIYKILVLDAFRIYDYLEENGLLPIYDIGCGMNMFANFYDVVGLDIVHPVDCLNLNYYKHMKPFDQAFASEYANQFPSAVAINSLHFIPANKISDRIYDFASVIKPGGIGYITFNLEMVYNNTNTEFLMNNELFYPAKAKQYLDGIVSSLDLNIIHYENTIVDRLFSLFDSIDGTARILFAKQ